LKECKLAEDLALVAAAELRRGATAAGADLADPSLRRDAPEAAPRLRAGSYSVSPVTSALAEAWERGEDVLVPSIVYAEALVRSLERGGKTLERAEEFFATQTIVPLDRAKAREAARLRGLHPRWLRMPDALVLATGLLRDANILTGDSRWARVSPLALVVS
jgi:predicted nucleic acid-binding protein